MVKRLIVLALLTAALAPPLSGCGQEQQVVTAPSAPTQAWPPSPSARATRLPSWLRTAAVKYSTRWRAQGPLSGWWALTTAEKASLASGTPGDDPDKDVYFVILKGNFDSDNYQFIAFTADPETHRQQSYVAGGGFERRFVGTMQPFMLRAQ